jgi:hypothetical protein
MRSDQYKPRKIDGRLFLKFAEDPLMAPGKVVYGEFLRPWYTDSQGHFVSEYEIGKAIHEFMIEYAAGRTKGIGINHVIWGGVGDLVECFQATDDMKMFTPGAGVAGVRCSDPTWAKVQNGELNGYSIGGSWTLIPIIPRVSHSKGIFQLMDVHIKDLSLVIKGAIRKDFTAYKSEDGETKEAWTTAYINDLPDAAFAYIEPDYKSGEIEDKNARHLPHHNKSVKNPDEKDSVDLTHLRNALARVNQLKPITDVSADTARSAARKHLEMHAKQHEIGEFAKNKQAFLQQPKGGRHMDIKAVAKQVLAEFLSMVGRKQDELQPVTPEALGDTNALATQMNLIISRVNANTSAILSAGAASAEGQPKEQQKPPEKEKPAGEGEGGGTGGEGGEGGAGGQGEGEDGTQGKPGGEGGDSAEGAGGEGGSEGGEGGSGDDGGAGEGQKEISTKLTILTDLLRDVDHRVQIMEDARGITMQDRLRGTKGAKSEKPGYRFSSMFGGYIPVDEEEESGAKKD